MLVAGSTPGRQHLSSLLRLNRSTVAPMPRCVPGSRLCAHLPYGLGHIALDLLGVEVPVTRADPLDDVPERVALGISALLSVHAYRSVDASAQPLARRSGAQSLPERASARTHQPRWAPGGRSRARGDRPDHSNRASDEGRRAASSVSKLFIWFLVSSSQTSYIADMAVSLCDSGWTTGRPVLIIRAAMHAHAASDRQPASALVLSVLSAAAIAAVIVSIISVVIIRPSARDVLG